MDYKKVEVLHTSEEVNQYLKNGWKLIKIFSESSYVVGLPDKAASDASNQQPKEKPRGITIDLSGSESTRDTYLKGLGSQESLRKSLEEDGQKLMHYFDAFIVDVISLMAAQ